MTKIPLRLSRRAVKQYFAKVSEASWEYYFDMEKLNGISECRVSCNGRIAHYNSEKIQEWLLQEGHYGPLDFQEPNLDSFLNLPVRRISMAG